LEKVHVCHMMELAKLKINKDIRVEENVDMSKHTSFKAGGKAAFMVEAGSIESLKQILRLVSEKNIPHMVLGNGSNTLFKDSGYDGVVIKLASGPFSEVKLLDDINNDKLSRISGKEITVSAGSAVLLSSLAKILLSHGISGFEFASGIPGSLGGALFMNAGAYGGEMKDIVQSVKAISPDGKEEKIFSNKEMNFEYRHSILEENGYIAVEAFLHLPMGDKKEIDEKMKDLAQRRNSKQPVSYPSAGSTFKRPEGYFAGKLIEDAGLKGVTVGGAQVSTLHSGFIINKGGATATDIIQLITLVQNRVYDEFGVMLHPEVRIIG